MKRTNIENPDITDKIKKIKKNKDIQKEGINNLNTDDDNMVSMHIRKTDYVYSSDYNYILDLDYYNKLSIASKTTMKYQGGIMTEKEIIEFRSEPFFEESLKIRYLDEINSLTEFINSQIKSNNILHTAYVTNMLLQLQQELELYRVRNVT